MSTKYCPECDTGKPLSEFANNAARGDGKAGWCKSCSRAYTARWKKQNPDINALHARIYRANKKLSEAPRG